MTYRKPKVTSRGANVEDVIVWFGEEKTKSASEHLGYDEVNVIDDDHEVIFQLIQGARILQVVRHQKITEGITQVWVIYKKHDLLNEEGSA